MNYRVTYGGLWATVDAVNEKSAFAQLRWLIDHEFDMTDVEELEHEYLVKDVSYEDVD